MKNVFVSGGDKGIGKAIVEKLTKLGYSVIFTYHTNINGARIVEKMCNQSYSYQCNFKDINSIKKTIGSILNKHKKIDIVINNAGTNIDNTFTNLSEDDWNDVIDINLKSVFYFTQAFIPYMIKNNFGRIINFSSITAFKGGCGIVNYSSSKAGIIGFTKSLAIEVASKGITVNAIAPGYINTDMFRNIPKDLQTKIIDSIPMKRLGNPEEVADLISFLVNDKASYITGQVIHINGGIY